MISVWHTTSAHFVFALQICEIFCSNDHGMIFLFLYLTVYLVEIILTMIEKTCVDVAEESVTQFAVLGFVRLGLIVLGMLIEQNTNM